MKILTEKEHGEILRNRGIIPPHLRPQPVKNPMLKSQDATTSTDEAQTDKDR